jgi:hypothetical protein
LQVELTFKAAQITFPALFCPSYRDAFRHSIKEAFVSEAKTDGTSSIIIRGVDRIAQWSNGAMAGCT